MHPTAQKILADNKSAQAKIGAYEITAWQRHAMGYGLIDDAKWEQVASDGYVQLWLSRLAVAKDLAAEIEANIDQYARMQIVQSASPVQFSLDKAIGLARKRFITAPRALMMDRLTKECRYALDRIEATKLEAAA